jgi:excisionase family DNA binding protein
MSEPKRFEDKLNGEKDANFVRLCYDLDELARALRVSRGSIYKMVKAGRLRPIKWFGRTLFRVQDVERLLDELAKESQNESKEESDTMGFCTTDHAWAWEFTGLRSDLPDRQSNWRPLRGALANARTFFRSCFRRSDSARRSSISLDHVEAVAPSNGR